MAKNSHTHVVYGYVGAPIGEPLVMGFGKSDVRALADAKRQTTQPLHFYFVRSDGAKVPAYSAIRSDGRDVIISVPD